MGAMVKTPPKGHQSWVRLYRGTDPLEIDMGQKIDMFLFPSKPSVSMFDAARQKQLLVPDTPYNTPSADIPT